MSRFDNIYLGLISWFAIVYRRLANPQSHILPLQAGVLPETSQRSLRRSWTVLGGILLTWTILADLFLFRGGILGDEWIVEELRQAMVYWHSLFEALFGTVEA